MADIFISYSQLDRERIRPIADALIERGYTVFWDPDIGPGERFRTVVDAELDACSCVVVVWTSASVQSDWVIDEAEEGRRRNILIPVLLDEVEPPRGFRQIHFLDLTSLRGRNGRRSLEALLQAVAQILDRPSGDSEAKPVSTGRISTGRLRQRLWLRSLGLAVPLGLAAAPILYFSYGASEIIRDWRPPLELIAGVTGVLSMALGFWMRYAVFVQDRLLGLSSLRLLSRSFLMVVLAGVLTAAPAEPLWLLHRDLFTGVVTSAEFNPTGTRVVTAARDNTARLWDARAKQTKEPIGMLRGHERPVSGAAYILDGTRILTWSRDHTARLWDSENLQQLKVLRGHTGWVLGAVESPDRTRILTWSRDNTARQWDAATSNEVKVLKGHTGWVSGAAYSPEGDRIVTWSNDGTVRQWGAATGDKLEELKGLARAVSGAVYSPDGAHILTWSTDETASLWNAQTGKSVGRLENGHTDDVLGARYVPDDEGDRILTWSRDNTARLWNAATRHPTGIVLINHKASVRGAIYIRNRDRGDRILTWSRDNTSRLWEAATGRQVEVLEGHTDFVLGADYSKESERILTWSRDNTVRLWDAWNGKEPTTLGHVPKRTVMRLPPMPLPFVLIYADEPVPAGEPNAADARANEDTQQRIVKTVRTSTFAFLRGLLFVGVLTLTALILWHTFRIRTASWLFSAAILYVGLSYLTHLPAEALLIWFLTAVVIGPALATVALISSLILKFALPAGFRPASAEIGRMRV